MTPLRVGTRGSQLALTQTGMVIGQIRAAHPFLEVEQVVLKTSGDQKADIALSSAGGVGLFTKELEDALLRGDIDVAVHSLKDLPTRLAAGLHLAAISTREDFRDAWLSPTAFQALPQGAVVGTGSPRRRAQLSLLRPDLSYVEFRGNVDTRLSKLERKEVAGAVLALAGLKRLGLEAKAQSLFSEQEMLPAPGQGFLALEARAADIPTHALLSPLNDPEAEDSSEAERGFIDRLGAGCHAPVAALARRSGKLLNLVGFTQNQDGKVFKAALEGQAGEGRGLGAKLAEKLIAQGAELTR